MSIAHLDPVMPVVDPPEMAGGDHPMRKVTRQVAFDGGWDPTRAGKVAALFDGMASEWDQPRRAAEERWAALRDALDRGDVPAGRVLELGSGTGMGTRVLAASGRPPIAVLDIASDMLAHAPPDLAPRVQGDASALPFPDSSVDVVVMVNALLFPEEVDRVLTADGCVVWNHTVGEQTPIHLPADDVADALPGTWTGVASRAGTGTWAVLRRA
ncbi:MAG: methyltransferase domain-containing protein [Actinomycetota bacterium]